MLLAWLTENTENLLTFIIVAATFLILIVGILWNRWRQLQKRHIDCNFLIPQSKYPYKTFDGAPVKEGFPRKLTVGIGTYTLILQIGSKMDILIDPINVIFVGKDDNKPRIDIWDNPFVIQKFEDGSYRDWWGDMHQSADQYPRQLYHGLTLQHGIRITTSGEWNGKVHIHVPIREIGIIKKQLDFIVSKTDDDIPFLQIIHGQATIATIISADSTTNISRPC